ncbi:MAG: hypothetical protein CMM50_06535 [Rhodospirillaceae bacterium]|nr:hypothetical protein [Rhodospirillaceae bacterium]
MTSTLPPDFTLEGYRALIAALMDRGYAVVDFADARPEARHLILRHDVDMSLDAALAVAEVEAAMGFSAHYFVLLRSELYNPFAPAAMTAMRRLLSLGHRVGLHFDGAAHGSDAIDAAVADECALLETLTGAPVTMVSFHRPAAGLLGHAAALAGRAHAYQPRFFSEMGYCSDSRGQWGHGHPLEHPAVADGRALQLLTHPIWWTRTKGEGVVVRLDRFVDDRSRVVKEELAANCEPYRDRGTRM